LFVIPPNRVLSPSVWRRDVGNDDDDTHTQHTTYTKTAIEGYAASGDVGKINARGQSEVKYSTGRTSTNAWCSGVCYRNSTAIEVSKRLSELTGVPERNSEYLQMLRYEPNQFYNEQ